MASGDRVPVTEVVESLVVLMRAVHELGRLWNRRWAPKPMRFWFRGTDDSCFTLDPSLLRPPFLGEDLQQHEYGIGMDFRIRGRPYYSSDPRNGWEQMFLMQHYGFPTRLLDWSESLATGAYFSSRSIDSDTDGAVWVLAPNWLAQKDNHDIATHYPTDHPRLARYALRTERSEVEEFNQLVPLPILPEHIDSRLIAQRGRFTVHTFEPGSLESLAVEDRNQHGDACFLHKFVVPARAKPTVRQQACIFGGASEDTLFPGLDGLARGMRWEALARSRR